jgi:hypothetical protein
MRGMPRQVRPDLNLNRFLGHLGSERRSAPERLAPAVCRGQGDHRMDDFADELQDSPRAHARVERA